MDCPFCGKRCTVTTKLVNLPGSIPVVDYYYWCKDKIDCRWSAKFRLEYVDTLAPSAYGHISHGGEVIKYLPPVSHFESLPNKP